MKKSKAVTLGILSSFCSAFIATLLVTVFYRFPVPFAEQYATGREDAFTALLALLFYGILGGFIVVLAIGLLSSHLVCRFSSTEGKMKLEIIGISASVNLLAVILLSTLDKIIGPW